MKPVGIFGNNISKCPDIMRKRTPFSLHRVPPVRSNKVKDYVSSVGSPCIPPMIFSSLTPHTTCNSCVIFQYPASLFSSRILLFLVVFLEPPPPKPNTISFYWTFLSCVIVFLSPIGGWNNFLTHPNISIIECSIITSLGYIKSTSPHKSLTLAM